MIVLEGGGGQGRSRSGGRDGGWHTKRAGYLLTGLKGYRIKTMLLLGSRTFYSHHSIVKRSTQMAESSVTAMTVEDTGLC